MAALWIICCWISRRKIDFSGIYYERVSRKKIGNLPLWHINIGYGRVAEGVFAVGLAARGIFAVGLASVGVVSIGILPVGLIALGCLALGLLAVGGISVGVLALGAIAVGIFSIGALAIGQFAVGAAAFGKYAALGDSAAAAIAIGEHEARCTLFEMYVGSWSAWYEHGDTVKALLDERVPWYLSCFENLFLWFCKLI